ncbi:hypothetical protein AAVH_00164 [Aphelenchoides avenae]|nr:hypothetical protein AAVH_00164 [Aphelenchus avenae]
MDVSDESRSPSPARQSNEELKRLEEEGASKKKQVLDELNGELLAVKERILDTEKSHEEVQAKIKQLESEREEYEKALSCLREHEKRLLARREAAGRDDSP